MSAIAEYFLEQWLFPDFKPSLAWCSYAGLVMAVLGDGIRKAAEIQAGSNFSHLIRTHRKDGHQLVTTGLYSLCRHPSYTGWWVWSVGTQVLLCNPVSVCTFFYASWVFFSDRVPYEERYLLSFFGERYADYQRRVSIGLPCVQSGRLRGGAL